MTKVHIQLAADFLEKIKSSRKDFTWKPTNQVYLQKFRKQTYSDTYTDIPKIPTQRKINED